MILIQKVPVWKIMIWKVRGMRLREKLNKQKVSIPDRQRQKSVHLSSDQGNEEIGLIFWHLH